MREKERLAADTIMIGSGWMCLAGERRTRREGEEEEVKRKGRAERERSAIEMPKQERKAEAVAGWSRRKQD